MGLGLFKEILLTRCVEAEAILLVRLSRDADGDVVISCRHTLIQDARATFRERHQEVMFARREVDALREETAEEVDRSLSIHSLYLNALSIDKPFDMLRFHPCRIGVFRQESLYLLIVSPN